MMETESRIREGKGKERKGMEEKEREWMGWRGK